MCIINFYIIIIPSIMTSVLCCPYKIILLCDGRICVNYLPKVVTRQQRGRNWNSQPLSCMSNVLVVAAHGHAPLSAGGWMCLPTVFAVGRGDHADSGTCYPAELRSEQGLVCDGHRRLGGGFHWSCCCEHRLGRQFRGKLGLIHA